MPGRLRPAHLHGVTLTGDANRMQGPRGGKPRIRQPLLLNSYRDYGPFILPYPVL